MHVDGGHLLEDRPRIGEQLNLAMGIAQCGRQRRKVGAFQRQQLQHDRFSGQGVLDLGVDEVNLIHLIRLERIDHVRRDVTRTLQCGGLAAVQKIFHQAGVLVQQGAVAGLAHHIKAGLGVIAAVRFQKLEQVLVVRTGHAFVCRQHQIGAARRFRVAGVEERVDRFFRQVGQHAGHRHLHALKVRRNRLVIFACLAQLGGGDQVHGIGDLHGVLNALNTLLEQLSGWHGHRLPQMRSRRSGWSAPVRG